jgi:hypothetical protein
MRRSASAGSRTISAHRQGSSQSQACAACLAWGRTLPTAGATRLCAQPASHKGIKRGAVAALAKSSKGRPRLRRRWISASPNLTHYMDCSCHNNTPPREGAQFGLKNANVPAAKHFCPPLNFGRRYLNGRRLARFDRASLPEQSAFGLRQLSPACPLGTTPGKMARQRPTKPARAPKRAGHGPRVFARPMAAKPAAGDRTKVSSAFKTLRPR